jgi:hypothetical protein
MASLKTQTLSISETGDYILQFYLANNISLNNTNGSVQANIIFNSNTLVSTPNLQNQTTSGFQLYTQTFTASVTGNYTLEFLYLNNSTNNGVSVFSVGNITINKVDIPNPISGYILFVNGNVRAKSYNAFSDRRLKDNIQPMESQWSNILSLRPVAFDWKHTQSRDIGFIAQDLYQVYPNMRQKFESIQEDDESCLDEPTDESGKPLYYGIDYGRLTPLLCKGLQETMQEIDSLKRERQILHEYLDAMNRRLLSLEQPK